MVLSGKKKKRKKDASLRPQLGEIVLRSKFSSGSHRHRILVRAATRAAGSPIKSAEVLLNR